MKRININPGDTFGSRTVIKELEHKEYGHKPWIKRMFEVRCKCGAVSSIEIARLRTRPQSCKQCPTPSTEIKKGDQFGLRTVIKTAYRKDGKRGLIVDVKCKCGTEQSIPAAELLNQNRTRCLKCKDWTGDPYEEFRPFVSNSLYGIWHGIKSRILNPNEPAFSYYGGRGLTMEKTWQESFGEFALWVKNNLGPSPGPGFSIDRIDNRYGYHPTKPDGSYQLRWATQGQQNSNRRPFRKNWGQWQVGEHVGSLFNVCKKWGLNDTSIKQYTKEVRNREALSLKEALEFNLQKKHGFTPEVTMLEAPTVTYD